MIASSLSPAAPLPSHMPGIPYVRPATETDDEFVADLHALAFGPGRYARTAFRVREQYSIDPSLSLIAEVDGALCGVVWMTPLSVGGINGYMLGPLATHPAYRKRGAGKLLAREVTRLALARGEGKFVLLVGDRDYYCPLGWEPTAPGAIVWPGPVDKSRVLAFSYDTSLPLQLAGPLQPFIAY
ncbi:N-acetyltransferase GCN5 [Devosia pacifica]|uniref:N-acetyltransferase GCN5 n=1 Tax=Devosia pacifica TaxID=1335967 RepID=A0A918S1H1_9HYPH|nr:N-acetyltransferase [Devosia pacifica]GHA17442.1 N-acetyltransferase GCN5 [Devosia pacifica]